MGKMMTKPITVEFINDFLCQTERKWATSKINEGIYGFQIQKGTRWNPGLSQRDIDSYQFELNVQFPEDFKTFLQHANGTDLQTVNVYGNSGLPHAFAPGVYNYPRDLMTIKSSIEELLGDRDAALTSLGLKQDVLGRDPKFIPFYGHRYVLCGANPEISIVCSILGSDAIVYATNLQEYLITEFL
jgi:hypothetical protein